MMLAASPGAIAQAWQASESNSYYAISGTTPLDLYRSIGERGPKLKSGNRAIAHTLWDLKWRRDYQRRGNGCVLASARPFLAITYTLPRPQAKLTGETARRWKAFIAGIRTHEKRHGAFAIQTTHAMQQATVGLATQSDDRKCNRLRARVLEQIGIAFEEYKRINSAFERSEMAQGGAVHRLILSFVAR